VHALIICRYCNSRVKTFGKTRWFFLGGKGWKNHHYPSSIRSTWSREIAHAILSLCWRPIDRNIYSFITLLRLPQRPSGHVGIIAHIPRHAIISLPSTRLNIFFFGREMKIIDKRTDGDDCYGYMRLTHALAVCWGLPITRRRTGGDERDGDPDVVRGIKYITETRQQELLSIFLIFFISLRYFKSKRFPRLDEGITVIVSTVPQSDGRWDYNINIHEWVSTLNPPVSH